MKEVWKDIKDFEGLYQVSNLGRVRSLPRNTTSGKILKPRKDIYGYVSVCLFKEGVRYWKKIHRLVAQEFIAIPNGLKDESILKPRKDIYGYVSVCLLFTSESYQ